MATRGISQISFGLAPSGANLTSGTWDLADLNSGWLPGDLAVFVWYSRESGRTFTPPGTITQKVQTSSAGFGHLYIGYRYLLAGDTTFAWSATSSTNNTNGYYVITFRNTATSGDPFERTSGANATTFSNTQSPNPPAITAATVLDLGFAITVFGKNNDGSATPPSGYGNGAGSHGFSETAGTDASSGIAEKGNIAAGVTEDPGVWTLGGASTDDGLLWTAVIRSNVRDTFTADALIKSTVSSTFTADAVIKSTTSSSLTANAVIKRISGDWQTNGPIHPTNSDTFGAPGSQVQLARSFSPARSGLLSEVRYALGKVNSPTDDAIVEIQSDSSGVPSGTVLTTVETVSGASLPTGNVDRVVATSLAVTSGTTYWLVFRRSGVLDGSNRYKLGGGMGNASGTVGRYDGASWSIFPLAIYFSAYTPLGFTLDAYITGGAVTGNFTGDAVIKRTITVGSELIGATASSGSTNSFGSTGAQRVAQSFQPSGSGLLSRVSWWPLKQGSPPDNAVLELQSDDSNKPSGTVLTTIATLSGATLPGHPVLVEQAHDASYPVTGGSRYWLVARRSGALDDGHGYEWYISTDNYAGGARAVYDGGSWSVSSEQDHKFQVVLTELTTGLTANAVIKATVNGSFTANAVIKRTVRPGEVFAGTATFSFDTSVGRLATEQEAQSFQPSVSGALDQIIWSPTSAGASDNLILELRSDDSNKPSGTVLTTITTIAAASLPALDGLKHLRTESASDYPVTSGTRYWLVARRSGALSDAADVGVGRATDSYTGGGRSTLDDGVWSTVTSDWLFTVSVVPPSLTADAVIFRTQTGAFTANAVVRAGIAGSFTLNAVIKRTVRPGEYYIGVSDLGSGLSFGEVGGNDGLGQSFTPSTSGVLVEAAWAPLRVGSPSDSAIFELQSDDSNEPSTSVLQTIETVSGASLPSVAWRYISTSYAVTASTRYWLVARRSGATDSDNYYGWAGFDGGDLLAGAGLSIDLAGGAGWITGQADDLTFRVWIVPPSLTADAYIHASFTANAVIKKTASGHLTLISLEAFILPHLEADAVIRRTQTGSLTADAHLVAAATVEGSFTANAVILRTQSGALTADADLRATIAGSVTANAVVARIQSGSLTADAVVKRTVASTITADAALRSTISGPRTADAVVFRAQAGSLTADAFVHARLTANAVVRREATGSFTANAVVFRTIAGSLIADAVVRREVSGSFAANATILQTQAGSLTANGVVLRTQTGALTANAFIPGRLTGDAVVRREQAGSFSANAFIHAQVRADAVIRATLTGSLTSDAFVLAANVGAISGDAVIRATIAGSTTADAVVRRTAAGTVTTDAVIARTSAASLSADAVILRTGTGSSTADAVVRATATGSLTANAVHSKTIAGSSTADAVITRTQSGTFAADAVLARAGAGTFAADAVINRPATGSLTADALILDVVDEALSANAVVKTAPSSSSSADAVLFKTIGGSFTTDAVVRATGSGSFTCDAVLAAGTIEGSFSADAWILRVQSGSIAADAFVQSAGVGAISGDAVIRREISATVTADAIVNRPATGSLTANAVTRATVPGSVAGSAVVHATATGSAISDAAIARTQTGSATADAHISVVITGNFTANAVATRTASATVAANAVIRAAGSGSFTSDAVKRKTDSASVTVDATVLATRTVGVGTDAVFFSLQTSSFTASSVISLLVTGSIGADARIAPAPQSITADAVLFSPNVKFITASAFIRKPRHRHFHATLVAPRTIGSKIETRTIGARLDVRFIGASLGWPVTARTGSLTAEAVIDE